MVSVLVCRHSADVRTLHAGAGLAGVAAEIILRVRYAFWLPGLFGELLSPFHQLSKALYLPSLVIEITLIKPQIVGRTECWVLSVDD